MLDSDWCIVGLMMMVMTLDYYQIGRIHHIKKHDLPSDCRYGFRSDGEI